MTLSNQLSDYVSPGPVSDLTHAVFTRASSEELKAMLVQLASDMCPVLGEVIDRHIAELPLPGVGEVINVAVLPNQFPMMLALRFDEFCPDWNIVQKSIMYMNYLEEFRKAAQVAYLKRVNGKIVVDDQLTGPIVEGKVTLPENIKDN